MDFAIEIKNVSKLYGNLVALDNASLNIPTGHFFGLLGPNGAGKTTLIKTIVGLAKKSHGSISVHGLDTERDYRQTRSLIGLSPQEANVDRMSTIKRILQYQGGYCGLKRQERIKRAEMLLEKFKLTDKANDYFRKLSGGMQRRVMIARSLMGKPRILILDEPSAGVDVEQRQEMWSFLKNLNADGTTIILTTHYIEEAEELCEQIGIIDKGKIIEHGTTKDLIEKYTEQYFLVNGKRQEKLNGHSVNDIEVKRGNLEEVFLKVTGHGICNQEVEETKT